MSYSPYRRNAVLSFNDDNSITDSALETIATLLDMEVKELDEPVMSSDAVVATKYVALPNTNRGIALYRSPSSTAKTYIVGIYNGIKCTSSHYSINSATTAYLYNISDKTKVISFGSVGLILTTGTNSNGEECCVHMPFSTSTAHLNKNGIKMNSSDLTTYGLTQTVAMQSGSDYVVMLPLTFPNYDCNIDTIYCAVNVTEGKVISLNNNIYSVICTTTNSNQLLIKS